MEHISSSISRAIKSIPTYYGGIKFRSRLEASYAKFFDSLKIKWAYEPEGYNIDGTNYLPDFWMPDITTFFEVKGPMVPGLSKAKKLYKYFNADLPDDAWWNPHYMVVYGNELGCVRNIADNDSIHIGLCGICGEWWFYAIGGFYGCRSCGGHDGASHISEYIEKITLSQVSI